VKIVMSKAAQRALVRSSKRELINEKIMALAADPSSLVGNIVRMKGGPESRLRVQDWRVVFRIEDGTVFIDEIGPRSSIYGG
jgi:mRNA interferase RelE/StbE